MEANAAIGIAALVAVFQVAADGAADMRQLTPDLVMPAGFQIDFQQGVTLRNRYRPVIQHGLFRPRPVGVANIAFVLLLVPEQVIFQASFGRMRPPLHNGPIGLLYLAVRPEHVVQARQRLAGARKQHDPARRAVEAA